MLVGRATAKQWWRNFTEPRQGGVPREGLGRLVPMGHPGRSAAERVYSRGHPYAHTSPDDPMVVIRRPAAYQAGRASAATTPPSELLRGGGNCGPGDGAGNTRGNGGLLRSGSSSRRRRNFHGDRVASAGRGRNGRGILLGAAQAHVLHQVLPDLRPRRWVAATAVAAGLAWLLGLLPSAMLPRIGNRPAAAGLAAVDGLLLLLSLGAAQWWVLRRHITGAGTWIPCHRCCLAGRTGRLLRDSHATVAPRPISLSDRRDRRSRRSPHGGYRRRRHRSRVGPPRELSGGMKWCHTRRRSVGGGARSCRTDNGDALTVLTAREAEHPRTHTWNNW
ncbi:hypothetical protein S1361_31760 [Streptomyces cyanogenus]|uniref:Uncharacterized protein n=1 Tax=Streptomyces cyanogenus TaxID=80860 RepID=A0ABX7TYV9_STRCY|nr:hypothetical protein S1361_31760 [Streptomyces cyanogenus]